MQTEGSAYGSTSKISQFKVQVPKPPKLGFLKHNHVISQGSQSLLKSELILFVRSVQTRKLDKSVENCIKCMFSLCTYNIDFQTKKQQI